MKSNSVVIIFSSCLNEGFVGKLCKKKVLAIFLRPFSLET